MCIAVTVLIAVVGWRAITHPRKGRYLASHVLFAPDLLTGRAKPADVEPKSRLVRSFVFERVEVLSGGALTEREHRRSLSPQLYARFYQKICDERSLMDNPQELEASFQQRGVIQLFLILTPQGSYAAEFGPQCQQTVQISPQGGLVRVQREMGGSEWIYFRVPGVERLFSGMGS